MDSSEELWNEVNSFCGRHSLITSKDFNAYTYSIEQWMRHSSTQDYEKLRQDHELCRHYTQKVAELYAAQFDQIAQAYIHKALVMNKVVSTLKDTIDKLNSTIQRFQLDPKALLDFWKKTQKYQHKIKLLNEIQDLTDTPLSVSRKLQNGNVLEAVNHIRQSLVTFNEHNFDQIRPLSDVQARLAASRTRVIDYIFDGLFNQLFVHEKPTNFTFFPHSQTMDLIPEVSTQDTIKFGQALQTLDAQRDFISMLQEQLESKLSALIEDTSSTVKTKKRHTTSEAKDGFAEFLEIAESFKPTTPLVMFVDSILCKLWVLLARCYALDEYLNDKNLTTLLPAWNSVNSLISNIASTFTAAVGNKMKMDVLRYSFLSTEMAPSSTTISTVRMKLGVKPSSFNSIHLFPLMAAFSEKATIQFKLSPPIDHTSTVQQLRNDVSKMVSDYSTKLASEPIVLRPIRSEIHSVPIFFSTSHLVDSTVHFMEMASKFPSLSSELCKAVCKLINSFESECKRQFTVMSSQQQSSDLRRTIYATKLLSLRSMAEYLSQPLVEKLVINTPKPGGENEITEDILKQFAEFEEKNELDLMSGKVSISVEETVRERFQLPAIANVAESLVAFYNRIEENIAPNFKNEMDQNAIRIELRKLIDLEVQCLCFLHVELRCKCYAEIVPALVGASYRLPTTPTQPDSYTTLLAQNYQGTYERLSTVLTASKLLFVFIGIPRLVYNLHVKFLPKVREINDKGSDQIALNLSTFRQMFQQSKYPEKELYRKISWLVANIYLSTDRIYMNLKTSQERKLFTFDEIKQVFQMQQKASENQEENLQNLQRLFDQN